MKIRFKTVCYRLLTAILLLNSSLALAALKATINKNIFSQDEAIQLTLHGDSQTPFHSIDLAALSNDFEIIQRSNEKRFSVTNGQMQETVKLNLLMRANRHGRLMIPSLKVGNEKTDAIQIQVNKGDPQNAGNSPQQAIYLDMHWLKEDPAYVQAQMTLALKIRHDGSLQQGQLDSPNIKDAMVNTLGSDTTYQENIDGRTWQVIERRFAVTPLKSGELTVPPLRFQGQISKRHNRNRSTNSYFESFFSQPVTLHTQPLKRDILPPAKAFTGSSWLPAKSVSLSMDEIQKKPFAVGDPINLKINVEAVGLLAEQLPGIQMDALPDKVSVYPDDPKLSTRSDKNNVLGKLSLDIVLIPSQAGDFKLPEIAIDWWNTLSNKQQTATLKLPTFKVIEAAVSNNALADNNALAETNTSPSIKPSTHSDANTFTPPSLASGGASQVNPVWQWIALCALGGWLLTAVILLRRRPENAQTAIALPASRVEDQKRLFNQVKKFALSNDGVAMYQALQTLDRHISKHSNQASGALQAQLAKMGLYQANQQIEKLKQHLFASPSEAWDSKAAWPLLAAGLQKGLQSNDKSVQSAGLKPLYPKKHARQTN